VSGRGAHDGEDETVLGEGERAARGVRGRVPGRAVPARLYPAHRGLPAAADRSPEPLDDRRGHQHPGSGHAGGGTVLRGPPPGGIRQRADRRGTRPAAGLSPQAEGGPAPAGGAGDGDGPAAGPVRGLPGVRAGPGAGDGRPERPAGPPVPAAAGARTRRGSSRGRPSGS
jgi:hypothetical protein